MERRSQLAEKALRLLVDSLDGNKGWLLRASGFKDTLAVNFAREVLRSLEAQDRKDASP